MYRTIFSVDTFVKAKEILIEKCICKRTVVLAIGTDILKLFQTQMYKGNNNFYSKLRIVAL